MLAAPKLTRGQYEYLSSTFKTLAEGIILGSSAAFFLPEAFQMEHQISATRYFAIFLVGLILLLYGAILQKKSK